MWSAGLSHTTFFSYFQKAVDLSKDDLLDDILQDLNTEVSESPVVKYAGDIGWRNNSVIIQNTIARIRNERFKNNTTNENTHKAKF